MRKIENVGLGRNLATGSGAFLVSKTTRIIHICGTRGDWEGRGDWEELTTVIKNPPPCLISG